MRHIIHKVLVRRVKSPVRRGLPQAGADDAGNFSDNRYMPRSGETAPPPDLAAAAPAASQRSSGGFVRGGTLGAVAHGT